MSSEAAFNILEESVALLDDSLGQFSSVMPKPKLVPTGGSHDRYDNPDRNVYAMLRCVRLVSGFRAALLLTRQGYSQETCAILRTLQEFCHDLDLVIASAGDRESAATLQRKVTEYFCDEIRPSEDLLTNAKKPASMPRNKVLAAVGRSLSLDNPHRSAQIAKAIENVYSGYVHGNYTHTMELYNGRTQQFETCGQPDRIDSLLSCIALVAHPTLNNFAGVAQCLGLSPLAARLISQREQLEASDVYQRSSSELPHPP